MPKPIVAIIGRPNTGKSTLFNRLLQRREAIIDKQAGITRDRIYGDVEWTDRSFTVIDTGGYLPGEGDEIETAVRRQAELAIEEANLLLFIVDGREGITPIDSTLADIIRQSGKQMILVVNKIDNNKQESIVGEFFSMGFDQMISVSALSGRKIGDMLDIIVGELGDKSIQTHEELEGIRFSIVGMPNVGKSSITNALIGKEKSIVTEIPGTTRDAVDTVVKYYGKTFVLIDTAGLRRKSKLKDSIEFYSILRTYKAIDRAHIVGVVIDAVKGFGKQDQHIISDVIKKGKGLIILVNKWDLIDTTTHTQEEVKKTIKRSFTALEHYPILFISAKTKKRISKLLPECQEVYDRWNQKIQTRKLNVVLQEMVKQVQPPAVRGKKIKIKFVTQVSQAPPRIRFFSNFPELIPVSYRNFMENQLRSVFDLDGVPIKFSFRKS
ncbi:MAG: ribosome biogenesis GTPase Der [Candidatus Marinimicrobia bacterium]|nr:ribosome biogenesis GTPase Der [Candidatus Neomarinimicrobiota bacterium]